MQAIIDKADKRVREAMSIAINRAEIAKGWDMEGIRQQVVASQRRRRYLNDILRKQGVAWDYQPVFDAKGQYIRNTVPIFELEMRSRFPAVKKAAE